jgi:hypothetical protein
LAPAAATVAAAALARDLTEEPWEIVPEESLRDLRGGLDLGSLVANFAIQRVVEIDGVVVARMQIVISNLDRLNSGGMPTISVTGPLAEIVQFMKTPGNVSLAGAASTVVTNAAASTVPSSALAPAASLPMRQAAISPAPPSTPTSGAAMAPSPSAVTGPSITSSGGNTGAVSSTGTQSGSMAQMGSALATAVATANGTLPQSGSSTAPSASAASSSPSVAAATPSVAAVTPSLAAATTSASPTTNSPASPSPVSPPANPAGTATTAGTTQTIPVGTTGQVVVLNNLPNAAAITTAVQNSVHAATIQTQTTISATLNSIAFLHAFTLANSIRQQVAAGL